LFRFSFKDGTMPAQFREDIVELIRLAARKLTGFHRREFQAEMAVKYCAGSPRKAEDVFGWRRTAVELGLQERRTGIRCLDNTAARGRKKSEEECPELAQRIHEIVEPESQADPKFQTTLAYTRITAQRVRDELLKDSALAESVPSRQTVGEMLGRLGYSLRRVQKTRPEKKFPKPTRSSRTSKSSVK
jgi:Rhodopirellula transposase DDE domain